jgi:lysophospholipase L1-like esterase
MAAKNVPLKTGLAIATCVAVLYGLHVYLAHHEEGQDKGLSPSIFQEAAKVDLFRHAPSMLPPVPPPPIRKVVAPGQRQPISPYFFDDSGALDPFFAALHELQSGAKPEVVTILHYGDSPTTADLITGDARAQLQAKFGDAGHGYLLTAKPWAWYQHRDVDISDHGWTDSTAVGKGREEVYGIGGASFEGGPGAGSHITIKDASQTSVEISYLARPNGGTVSVAANGAEVDSFSTEADSSHPAWHTVALPPATKSIDIKPISGSVRLFGENFRTGASGLLYDSLGLNGASTSVLSYGFNPGAWSAELQHDKPSLVIINYGTNESGFGSYVDKQYEGTLVTTIQRLRAALPGVPILVMSPMDRGRRTGVDEITTWDTIPRIVAIQQRVAAQQHCAFFDTFEAMGGAGTMSRWYNGHPRLVAGDLIHPSPQGAAMVAQLLVKDMLTAYDQYLKRLSGDQTASNAAAVAPTPTAAKPPSDKLPSDKPGKPPNP